MLAYSVDMVLGGGGARYRILAFHFVCADMDEALDSSNFGCLQQHMSAEHVGFGKLKRVAKRVV